MLMLTEKLDTNHLCVLGLHRHGRSKCADTAIDEGETAEVMSQIFS